MVRFYTVFLYSVVTVYMYLCTFCNRCTINGRYDDDDEGGLTIYPRVANFLQCTCAKNYKNWLTVDKVIAKIVRLTFLPPPCRQLVYMLGGQSEPDTDHQGAQDRLLWHRMVTNVIHDSTTP